MKRRERRSPGPEGPGLRPSRRWSPGPSGPGAILALLILFSVVAFAQDLPTLTAPVNDFADAIGPDVEQALDQRIRSLQTATGDVVIVATVQTMAPYGSIEEYAVKLFEKAAIGQKEKDNGALIVLALQERRVRIEVGYDLEEFITDGFAGDTIRQEMLPAFRQGDYGGGLLAGTTRVIQRIAERRGVTLQEVPAARGTGDDTGGSGIGIGIGMILLLFIFFIIGAIRRGSRGSRFRRGGWGGPFLPGGTWSGWSGGGGHFGGGGFGGGFGGFGGGRSGGGGASGGW